MTTMTQQNYEVILIAAASIKPTPHNPESRLRRVARLEESVNGPVGLIYPIVVQPRDHGYEIVEGNRRFAAMKRAGWTEIPCRILPEGIDPHLVYAEANATVRRFSGNEILGVYLKEPRAVSDRVRDRFQDAEAVIGRSLLKELYRVGLSLTSYQTACEVGRYCELESDEDIRLILQWLMRYRLTGIIRKAIQVNVKPSLITTHLRQDKPIQLSVKGGGQ